MKKNITRHGGICPDEVKLCEFVERKINLFLCQNNTNSEGISTSHKSLGWKMQDGVIGFWTDRIYKEGRDCKSHYAGRFDVAPKGDLKNLQMMVQRWMTDNIPMQAILALGAGATALSYSNMMWNTHMYNPIIHLVSNSSRGKSTAAKVIASFVGKPEGNASTYLTFLATGNAILKRIGSISGVPFAIDEFPTAKSKKEWSDFIYTLSNG
ncbi:MAG: DUF927 domain-containing protein [Lachnospiraceae bacterium]|nr:DUF927 domain-containing protein [Tyzzerella sp.]MBQ6806920.1 DUF927 domain-containing protein [Lachnospiraceae bacterium]